MSGSSSNNNNKQEEEDMYDELDRNYDEQDEDEFLNPDDIQDQIILDAEDFMNADFGDEGDDDEEGAGYHHDDNDNNNEEEDDGPNDSIAEFTKHTDSIYKLAKYESPSSSNEVLLATASGDDTAFLFKFNTETNQISNERHLVGHKDTCIDVGFSYDGARLATGSMDGTIGIWNVTDLDNVTSEAFLDGPGESIEWIQWHPKGNLLACGSADTTAWLWNVKTGKCLNVFAGHSGSVTAGGFTSDGKLLVTGSEDASVRVWNPVTAECVHVFQPHDTMFTTSPITAFKSQQQEPNLILTASEDGTAQLSHIAHKRTFGVLRGHEESIEAVDMSAYGSGVPLVPQVATASMDKRINIWDVSTLALRQTLQHNEGVTKVLFDTEKPLVYSCSVDKTVAVWDVRTGQAVRIFKGHRDIVLDIAKTNNSSHIFSASDDHALLVFKL